MPVLSQPNNISTVIPENTTLSSQWDADSRGRETITIPVTPNRYTLPQIRMEKVLAIRRQLADGVYSIDKRLDASLDRLLKDINI